MTPADRMASAGHTGLVSMDDPGDAVRTDGKVPEVEEVEPDVLPAISKSGETDEPPPAQMVVASGIPCQPWVESTRPEVCVGPAPPLLAPAPVNPLAVQTWAVVTTDMGGPAIANNPDPAGAPLVPAIDSVGKLGTCDQAHGPIAACELVAMAAAGTPEVAGLSA